MAFSFIKPDDLLTTFNDAKKYMTPLHEPLEEFERIARNRPAPGIAKDLPKVTDGTLAALIQEQPKRVIQEVPTGEVEANDPWLDIVATYLLTNEILPNSNETASLIQKCWAAVSKSLTYGSQPAYVRFLNRGDYFGTDFCLPYIKDVLLEPGKLSDRDSNVMFLRTWWSKNQIQAIIEKEKGLGKRAADRGDEYESGWDLAKLADLITEKPGQKDVGAQTPTEKNKQLNGGFYEIVHCFQDGIGAEFYSFAPRLAEDNLVRTRTNKDPRGVVPIHFLYANVDFSNPLGRGAIEMSGGVQNLLDSEMQMYQYNRALMLNPPMKKWGNVSKATLKYLPNAIWDMGASKEAGDVEPAQIDSTAIANFPANYGLLKSQILNLNSSSDTSISSEVGNPGFSKTPQGVKATEEKLGISDNYMRRQFESWFEEVCETQVNLWFAERSGMQELQVDEMTANKLIELNDSYVGPNNTIRIEYDSETPKLKFKVDPTSSAQKDNQEQIEGLQTLIQETAENPLITYYLDQAGYKMNLGEAYRQLYERYNIKDMSKILQELPKDQAGQMPYPVIDKPKVSIAYDDLPPAAQVGALQDAGIQVQPQDVMQLNAMQQASQKPETDPSAPEEHPIIKLMTTLNIKFTDLPEDAQLQLLQEIGLPSQMRTPAAIQTELSAHDAALKTADLQHKIDTSSQDQALKEAQFQQTQAQSQADNALKAAQFGHTVKSSDQSHQLAVKTANKPAPKGAK